ncbi:MAG: outer membrane protein assembly factor BamB [Tatlockia sp.]|nr:outer membrane protein assembly factor BamB [Tatlockia sp.]
MNKKIAVLTLCVSMQACTTVDDYVFGKDNTPAPKTLEPIKSKVKVAEKWSISLGGSHNANANSKLKPEIVGKVVYTADASGLIQAVDKGNGKLLWAKKLNSAVVSGPTVNAGYIALGTDVSTVVLLKQSDGTELWQAKTSGEVLSKPVIHANKVIAKTIDGNLYAFNLANGEKLWKAEHGAPSLILKASSSPVVIDNNLVLVGYSDGKMDAIDLHTGHVVWQRSIAYASGASDVERLVDIDADPIVRGSVAYLASYQGYVGALSLTDGQFVWRKPASVFKNMAIDGQTLYMTDSDDIVWSINRQNGRVNWKQVALKARGLTEPVLMGNRLVVGDKTGLLHVIATQTGELISRSQVGGSVAIAPSVAGNNIYVISTNGKLSRFSVS